MCFMLSILYILAHLSATAKHENCKQCWIKIFFKSLFIFSCLLFKPIKFYKSYKMCSIENFSIPKKQFFLIFLKSDCSVFTLRFYFSACLYIFIARRCQTFITFLFLPILYYTIRCTDPMDVAVAKLGFVEI